ncbi:ribosomal protein S4E [Brachybacterium sacelli]|uniref:Ribosomal protein S4E n=1 Tax=Brachybacterium sacelli TaxID=173364 RepID=A0ABS4X275_9MICO|nr:ribosomal protein S4E [Brachybacterium sacelli]
MNAATFTYAARPTPESHKKRQQAPCLALVRNRA